MLTPMPIERRKSNWSGARFSFTFEPGIPGVSDGLFLFVMEKKDPVAKTRKTFRLRMSPRSGAKFGAQVLEAVRKYEKTLGADGGAA